MKLNAYQSCLARADDDFTISFVANLSIDAYDAEVIEFIESLSWLIMVKTSSSSIFINYWHFIMSLKKY